MIDHPQQRQFGSDSPLSHADTLRDVAHQLTRYGARASVEYPAYVRITFRDGRIAHLGTANGTWQADIYRDCRHETRGELATETWTVNEIRAPWYDPETGYGRAHSEIPEGIARWIVGRATGDHALTAYASAAEERWHDRRERRMRPGR